MRAEPFGGARRLCGGLLLPPPRTPAVSRKVCACRAFWRSAALPRQGWVSASVWRACARRVFGQSAAPPRHSPPSLPFPSRAWRFGAAPPGVSAVGSPAAGGVAGDCGPGHYPPLPHAYPGGASCSFTPFKNLRPWVECATVGGGHLPTWSLGEPPGWTPRSAPPPPLAPSSPSRAWRFGAAPPGLAPLAPRLQAGSRGTAVRVTTLPFPMPTQAAPRVPLPCLRTRALGWSVLRWWGFPSYVVPWSPSLLAAPLGSPLAGSGRLGLG